MEGKETRSLSRDTQTTRRSGFMPQMSPYKVPKKRNEGARDPDTMERKTRSFQLNQNPVANKIQLKLVSQTQVLDALPERKDAKRPQFYSAQESFVPAKRPKPESNADPRMHSKENVMTTDCSYDNKEKGNPADPRTRPHHHHTGVLSRRNCPESSASTIQNRMVAARPKSMSTASVQSTAVMVEAETQTAISSEHVPAKQESSGVMLYNNELESSYQAAATAFMQYIKRRVEHHGLKAKNVNRHLVDFINDLGREGTQINVLMNLVRFVEGPYHYEELVEDSYLKIITKRKAKRQQDRAIAAARAHQELKIKPERSNDGNGDDSSCDRSSLNEEPVDWSQPEAGNNNSNMVPYDDPNSPSFERLDAAMLSLFGSQTNQLEDSSGLNDNTIANVGRSYAAEINAISISQPEERV